jgi:hypothetical protein
LKIAVAKHEFIAMTAIDNLRARKLQLEQDLRQALSEEQREWVESELTKIEIALSFLDDIAPPPTGQSGGRSQKIP